MKILVVGHFAFDVVANPDGSSRRYPGGIYHSVRGVAGCAEKGDKVIPVFGAHRDDVESVLDIFRALPGVETSGIFTTNEPTHHVHLSAGAEKGRLGCSMRIGSPIPFEKVRRWLDADGILVNMESGFDLTLETLDEIRMVTRGKGIHIHFDYHNLTLGVGEQNKRFRRPIPEWRRWAFMVDTVQTNEEEVAGLAVERMSEAQTVGHLLTLGVRGVVVTRGDRGASLYYNDHKKVVRDNVPPRQPATATGGIGRGDMFGGAFLASCIRTKDLAASVRCAVNAATEADTSPAGYLLTSGTEQLKDQPHSI